MVWGWPPPEIIAYHLHRYKKCLYSGFCCYIEKASWYYVYMYVCVYIYIHYNLYIILQVTWQLAVGIPNFVPLPNIHPWSPKFCRDIEIIFIWLELCVQPAEPWQEWVFPSEFAGGLLLLPFFWGRCTISPHPQCDLHGTHVFFVDKDSSKLPLSGFHPANLKYYLDGLKRLHPTYLQVWYFSRGILPKWPRVERMPEFQETTIAGTKWKHEPWDTTWPGGMDTAMWHCHQC